MVAAFPTYVPWVSCWLPTQCMEPNFMKLSFLSLCTSHSSTGMCSKIVSQDVLDFGLPAGVAKNMMFEKPWINQWSWACVLTWSRRRRPVPKHEDIRFFESHFSKQWSGWHTIFTWRSCIFFAHFWAKFWTFRFWFLVLTSYQDNILFLDQEAVENLEALKNHHFLVLSRSGGQNTVSSHYTPVLLEGV